MCFVLSGERSPPSLHASDAVSESKRSAHWASARHGRHVPDKDGQSTSEEEDAEARTEARRARSAGYRDILDTKTVGKKFKEQQLTHNLDLSL